VRAHTQDRKPVPITQQRGVRPGSLPGTLLNAVFLNLPNDDQDVRLSAWNLLCALSKAYHIEAGRQLRPAPGMSIISCLILGLYLPPHNIDLFVDLSREVSVKAPHLSLDFLGAFLEHFQSYTPQQKEYGLLYVGPWILQIETQLRTASSNFEQTAKEIKSLLQAFILLTYEKPQVRSQ
jgi:neurofibromin 1